MGFNSGFKGLNYFKCIILNTTRTVTMHRNVAYDMSHWQAEHPGGGGEGSCRAANPQKSKFENTFCRHLPLALEPAVGFGLLNNMSPFFPIYHQLSPSSHFLRLKIFFYFFSQSFLGILLRLVSSSSWVKIFLGILSSSILFRWPSQLILCPFIHFVL